jgi:hypothetical protein
MQNQKATYRREESQRILDGMLEDERKEKDLLLLTDHFGLTITEYVWTVCKITHDLKKELDYLEVY